MPINAALLGSGLFAQNAYLPALLSNTKDVTLHTIWSRSESSAKKLHEAAQSQGFKGPIQVVFGDEGLSKVLDDKDVDAVMLVLPISAQPDLIRKALGKGKHVMSEKPVGKDVATARGLIEEYEREYEGKGLIWRVAENYAHEPMFIKAGEILRNTKDLGPVLYYSLRQEGVIIDGSKYQATSWRTIPDYQGGFLLDGGVHSTAMLRVILPTPPAEIVSFSALHRTHLLPHDTLSAILLPPSQAITDAHGPPTSLEVGKTKSAKDVPTEIGKSSPQGSFLLSFAHPDTPEESRQPSGLFVTCLNGTLSVTSEGYPRKWIVKLSGAKDSSVKTESWSGDSTGVEVEVGMFGRAVGCAKEKKENQEENRASPRGALWDLAAIEAMLTSEGKAVNLEKLIAGK